MDIRKLQKIAVNALEDIKAKDIEVINTSKLTSLFDRIIIASGDSNRQTKALARNVHDKVKEAGGDVIGMEGEDVGEWVLVDLGDIVVHIMQPTVRSHYNLEELWQTTPKRPLLPRKRKPSAASVKRRVKLIVVAVGTRLPDWVNAGFAEFAKRMPRELPLELNEIKAEPRTTGKPVDAMMAAEAKRIARRCPPAAASSPSTNAAATRHPGTGRRLRHGGRRRRCRLRHRRPGRPRPDLKARRPRTLRLSSLTLPHALARVVLAEALYRALAFANATLTTANEDHVTLEPRIYLASQSPRRRELLTQIGVRFDLLLFRGGTREDPDTDEDPLPGETPEDYVAARRSPRRSRRAACSASVTSCRVRCWPPTRRWTSTATSSASRATRPTPWPSCRGCPAAPTAC